MRTSTSVSTMCEHPRNGHASAFAGVSVPSHELETVAYDPASGVERWTAHSSHIYGSSFPRHSQIDVSWDGAWVFVSGTAGDRYRLVAYASDTGAEGWTTAKRRNIGDVARIAASPSADVLFFTAENRRLPHRGDRRQDRTHVVAIAVRR